MTISELADWIIVYYAAIKIGWYTGIVPQKYLGAFWGLMCSIGIWLLIIGAYCIYAFKIQFDAQTVFFAVLSIITTVLATIIGQRRGAGKELDALRLELAGLKAKQNQLPTTEK